MSSILPVVTISVIIYCCCECVVSSEICDDLNLDSSLKVNKCIDNDYKLRPPVSK